MRTSELRDRVVAVAEEDAVVQLGRSASLAGLYLVGSPRQIVRELIQEQSAQRSWVARVAREQRSLHGLRQVDQREYRPIEVREVRAQALAV